MKKKMSKEQNIDLTEEVYSMSIFETMKISLHVSIMRVPGGWVLFKDMGGMEEFSTTTTFIPYLDILDAESQEYKGKMFVEKRKKDYGN